MSTPPYPSDPNGPPPGWNPPPIQASPQRPPYPQQVYPQQASGWGRMPAAHAISPLPPFEVPAEQAYRTGFPPPQPEPQPVPRRSWRRWWILGAAVVVLIGAGVAVALSLRSTVFAQEGLQTGVATILTRDYHLPPGPVTCPAGQEVSTGATFTCTVTIDGATKTVPIVVLDNDGGYSVGQPR